MSQVITTTVVTTTSRLTIAEEEILGIIAEWAKQTHAFTHRAHINMRYDGDTDRLVADISETYERRKE
jgi:hypothetical protein